MAAKDNPNFPAAARGNYVSPAGTTEPRRAATIALAVAIAASRCPQASVIVLNILCGSGHRFDGWFASSDAFREQCQRRLVQCPHCQTTALSLLPSAPHVRRSTAESPGENVEVPAPAPALAARIYQALATAARQAENVGERFPEEARRIHYEEVPARSIRGVASTDETIELLEEGILVLPAPVPHEDEFH